MCRRILRSGIRRVCNEGQDSRVYGWQRSTLCERCEERLRVSALLYSARPWVARRIPRPHDEICSLVGHACGRQRLRSYSRLYSSFAPLDALGLSDQLALFVNSLFHLSLFFFSFVRPLSICSARMFDLSDALWRTLYTLVSTCGLCLGS